MECDFFDMMLLIEMIIKSEDYSNNCLGYGMTCLMARPSIVGGSQGGIGLVTKERPVGWGIESMRYHGPNVEVGLT